MSGGFLEVRPDKVTILAQAAEKSEDIDVERAQRAKERAEQRLKEQKVEISISVVPACPATCHQSPCGIKRKNVN